MFLNSRPLQPKYFCFFLELTLLLQLQKYKHGFLHLFASHDCCNEFPETHRLKQHKFIFSQCWRLPTIPHNSHFFWVLSPGFIDDCLFPCVFTWVSLYACASLGSNLLFLEGHLLYWIRAQPNDPIPGFPGGSVVKNLPANAGDAGLIIWVGKIFWRRKWQRTPLFLPG